MTRISRIHAPRATLAAVALLAIFMLGFGALAEANHEAVATIAAGESAACASEQNCELPAPRSAGTRG